VAGNDRTDPFAGRDPFGDSDDGQRTYIKPRPGGRAPAPRGGEPTVRPQEDVPVLRHGLNPLVALANHLLMLVPALGSTRNVPDVNALRQSLGQSIRDFAASAATAGIAPDRIMAARYVLCTMIDEAASGTPWGGSGVWATHSLLAMFHNETEGGEKVFQLMARLAERPEANLDLLELIYCALALGFEGRYRVLPNGHAQLETIRSKLAQIIRKERGDYPKPLAEHWLGQVAAARKAPGWLALVAACAVAAVILAVVYTALYLSIETYSDPAFAKVQSLQVAPTVVALPQPAATPRLAQFLPGEIAAKLVDVSDLADRSIVTIRGDSAFSPGSATLLADRESLMGRVGDAVARVPGNVLVTGHTDNQPPSRSARYPSNFVLSEQRAQTVANILLAHRVAPERIHVEGHADSEPAGDNGTPAGRALNRRVEITVFTIQAPTNASTTDTVR
jgi:type VI secretion system protein ImpK